MRNKCVSKNVQAPMGKCECWSVVLVGEFNSLTGCSCRLGSGSRQPAAAVLTTRGQQPDLAGLPPPQVAALFWG